MRIGQLAFLAALFIATSAARADHPDVHKLRIAGAGVMQSLVAAMAKRFEAHHPRTRIEVKASTTSEGIRALHEGTISLAMVSKLPPGERGLHVVPLARDGVAAIVHKDNPLRSVTTEQLRDIYTEKITLWSQLGSYQGRIHPLTTQPFGASAGLFFEHLRLGESDIRASGVGLPNAQRVDRLAADKQAIHFLSIGAAERRIHAGAPIKLLAIDDVAASSRTVQLGRWPISRPLYLASKGAPSALAQQFIRFATSAEVTDLIEGHDFVPYLD